MPDMRFMLNGTTIGSRSCRSRRSEVVGTMARGSVDHDWMEVTEVRAMMTDSSNVLRTSGWDSTFRIVELLLEGKQV